MPNEPARRPRIAVVDDDSVFLSLMEDLLSEGGAYEVSTYRQGDQAYEFIKQSQPDLVIMDLVFNREEVGWNTLELVKLDPATTDIPVIMCSAATRSLEVRTETLEHRGVQTLTKPFNLDDLLAKISAVLATRPADQRAPPPSPSA